MSRTRADTETARRPVSDADGDVLARPDLQLAGALLVIDGGAYFVAARRHRL